MATAKGNDMDEMRVTEATTVPTAATFATKLKAALGELPQGKVLQVKTKEDRQAVTNAVTQLKKATGTNYTTRLISKRGEDGKMTIEIENKGPIPVVPNPSGQAAQAAAD